MNPIRIDLPPLLLLESLQAWFKDQAGNPDPELFFVSPISQELQLKSERQATKEIVVWLEIHNQPVAAWNIETQLILLNDRWYEFDRFVDSFGPFLDEEPRARDAVENVIEAAESLCGALENLADELPESVWEGFPDG